MPCFRWTLASVLLPIAAITGADDPVQPAPAAAGLERLAASFEDWPSARPLGACPLIDGAAIDAALEIAGIDARLAGWELSAVDGEPARATCRGEYVGALGDEQFPEVTVELAAMVPGTGDDPSGTECEHTTLLSECTGARTQEGVAISVRIADRVFVDAPTTDAVLQEVVPEVIGSLSERAADVVDPLAAIGAEDVMAASAALAAAISGVEDDPVRGDCPVLARSDLEAALIEAGIEAELEDWGAATRPLGDPGQPTVLECGGDSDGDASRDSFGRAASIQLVAFHDAGDAADFVASVGLPEGGSATDLPPGETVIASCLDAGGFGDVCTAWWWRDAFVAGVWLLSDSEPVTAADAEAVLVAIVPEVVDALT
jgi:hypothetical protein